MSRGRRSRGGDNYGDQNSKGTDDFSDRNGYHMYRRSRIDRSPSRERIDSRPWSVGRDNYERQRSRDRRPRSRDRRLDLYVNEQALSL